MGNPKNKSNPPFVHEDFVGDVKLELGTSSEDISRIQAILQLYSPKYGFSISQTELDEQTVGPTTLNAAQALCHIASSSDHDARDFRRDSQFRLFLDVTGVNTDALARKFGAYSRRHIEQYRSAPDDLSTRAVRFGALEAGAAFNQTGSPVSDFAEQLVGLHSEAMHAYLGLNDNYCGAAVDACLKRLQPSKPIYGDSNMNWAASYEPYAKKFGAFHSRRDIAKGVDDYEPQPGDIAVTEGYGKSGRHTIIIKSFDKETGDMVCISPNSWGHDENGNKVRGIVREYTVNIHNLAHRFIGICSTQELIDAQGIEVHKSSPIAINNDVMARIPTKNVNIRG